VTQHARDERHVGLLLDLQQLGREVLMLVVLLGAQLAP
jgi:hypothetical protein